MPHKLVIVQNPLEPRSVTFKCEKCQHSASFAKEGDGSPYFTMDKNGQPTLTALIEDNNGVQQKQPESLDKYLGECSK